MPISLLDIYQRLFDHYGPQHWWPGESRFEIAVGAVLTQNTAWHNVEAALENLRQADALCPSGMSQLTEAELAELIRPAGYYRLKARRLRNLLGFFAENSREDIDAVWALPATTLRERLLAVNGIGPETADSIVLYAAGHAVFVVDAYTGRLLKRHAWIDPEADYHAMQERFHDELPWDVELFREYHALIVRLGKEHCKRRPICETCPLREWLPPQGACDLRQ